MAKTKKRSSASTTVNTFSPKLTKAEKNKRRKYLNGRLMALYGKIGEWITGTEYLLKKNNIEVDGVKLPTAEIYSGNNLIISLKPTGLWAFGVNCRIDIVSRIEDNILLDVADESKPPDWELISMNPRRNPKNLTKMIFRNLLKRNNTTLKLVKLPQK